MYELLCKRDDVYVGYGALGVVAKPEGKTEAWLRHHCWLCERSRESILLEIAEKEEREPYRA